MILETSVGVLLLSAASIFYARSRLIKREDTGAGNVFVTTSKEIPGLEVKEIVGYIESSSVMPTEGDYSVELAEETTVQKLMDKAKSLGANAILELTIEKEEGNMHARIVAKGLAVRV